MDLVMKTLKTFTIVTILICISIVVTFFGTSRYLNDKIEHQKELRIRAEQENSRLLQEKKVVIVTQHKFNTYLLLTRLKLKIFQAMIAPADNSKTELSALALNLKTALDVLKKSTPAKTKEHKSIDRELSSIQTELNTVSSGIANLQTFKLKLANYRARITNVSGNSYRLAVKLSSNIIKNKQPPEQVTEAFKQRIQMERITSNTLKLEYMNGYRFLIHPEILSEPVNLARDLSTHSYLNRDTIDVQVAISSFLDGNIKNNIQKTSDTESLTLLKKIKTAFEPIAIDRLNLLTEITSILELKRATGRLLITINNLRKQLLTL